ncbi:MAG: hypothetical protein AB4042_05515 [Leptolyngbyaceae cyanobacterium]
MPEREEEEKERSLTHHPSQRNTMLYKCNLGAWAHLVFSMSGNESNIGQL